MVAEMKAEQIGGAARVDMQLLVPSKPILRRGVRLRPMGDTVVLDGADKGQVFSGEFAKEMLTPLVSKCDGTKTHEALAAEFNLDETTIYKCIALLWAAGVIEEAEESNKSKEIRPTLATFLSRLGNSTGVNASWTDAVTKLENSSVRLEGDSSLVESTRRALTGLLNVVSAEETVQSPNNVLTVFFENQRNIKQMNLVQRRCWEEKQPLLRIKADSRTVTIGPYVDPAITACLDCGIDGEKPTIGLLSESLTDLVAGMTVHHIVAIIARSTITHLPVDSSITDISSLVTRYHPITVRPGCPRCSVAHGPIGKASAATRYEASVAIPPRMFLSPKDHQAHYYASNLKLQSRSKDWPSRRHEKLPDPDTSLLGNKNPSGTANTHRALSLDTLSLLLKMGFGIKEGETNAQWTKRWTASAGNIGCTTAYVVIRDSSILPAGVYGYSQGSHSLAVLSTDVPLGESPCDLIVTGDLGKIMTKYGTFGFRLIFLDAGCSLTTISKVAKHLGIDFSPQQQWNSEVIPAFLAEMTSKEPIAAVASIKEIQ